MVSADYVYNPGVAVFRMARQADARSIIRRVGAVADYRQAISVLRDIRLDKLITEQSAIIIEYFCGYIASKQGALERCGQGQQAEIRIDVGLKRLVSSERIGGIHQQNLGSGIKASIVCAARCVHHHGSGSNR